MIFCTLQFYKGGAFIYKFQVCVSVIFKAFRSLKKVSLHPSQRLREVSPGHGLNHFPIVILQSGVRLDL